MLFMLGGLVALVLVLVVVFMPSVEPYTSANIFSSENNFLTIDKDGKLKLRPVVDVDNAIDAAAGNIAADVAATYKTKDSASEDRQAYMETFQTKAEALRDKAVARGARSAYQPKGDYVKRYTNYAIKMGPGNHGSGDRYLIGSKDHWRVAFNGPSSAKWQFV